MAKKISGGEHAKRAGLVSIQLLVTPEERQLIREAAAQAGDRSMGAFARRATVATAEKRIRKKPRNSIDSSESVG